MYLVITSITIAVLTFLYFFFAKKNEYWIKRHVKHPTPQFLLGNYGDLILLKKNIGMVAEEICEQFPNELYIGTYYGTEPAIIIKDPELVKLVLTKDFYYFSSRELMGHGKREVVSQNLFRGSGSYWKVLRQNLTPIFSTAKMKLMFPLIQTCTDKFDKLLEEEVRAKPVHEVKQLIARYTMDCIGSCAFGLDTDAMGKNIDSNPFRKIANTIFDTSSSRAFKMIARSIWPNIFYGLGFKAFPKEIVTFFWDLITKVFNNRDNQPSTRNDLVDYILTFKSENRIYGDELKNLKGDDKEKKKVSVKVDDDLLVAQCLMFFSAGFETSASTISFTLYELAKDQDSLMRSIAEVDGYLERTQGKVNYDCVTELPFLEACIDEALRLYPVLGLSTREVVEDYTLPSGLKLEKRMRVHLPTYYMHRNPEYFPEPSKYNPERFLPENKDHVVPYSYFPFGEGPRICIGVRFAKMLMLAGLVTVLKNYTMELAPDMPATVEFEPKSFVTVAKSGINIKFVPRP